jgi:hypothetical protein
MLEDDTWLAQQLEVELHQDEASEKLIRLQEFRIKQTEDKIRRVEEGFDGGIYTLEEAKRRKADHQSTIEKAKWEIARLKTQMKVKGLSLSDADALRQELKVLRERNLKEVSFKEKTDLVAMLGIKVYPSEDLKSRRVACQLNLMNIGGKWEQNDFAKVVFGEPSEIRT